MRRDEFPIVHMVIKEKVLKALEDVRAEIAEYGSIWVEYTIKGHTDRDIQKTIEDVIKQAKTQGLEIIDRKIAKITKDCTSCTHSNELDGESCYECVKGIKDNFEEDAGEELTNPFGDNSKIFGG